MQNPQENTVVIGAMHRVAEGQMFSKCMLCGAMAEKLNKPCPAYLAEAAKLLPEAIASGAAPQTLVEDFAAAQPAAQPVLAEMRDLLRELVELARDAANPDGAD